ncbi:MAG TPA: hypothetical protein VKP11_04400, partial [Frankiaceae bacterium]|nr:hypothetical protein [Frankiaceae bacterium]
HRPADVPTLATDCRRPGLAVQPTTAARNQIVRYAVIGPPDAVYAVAVDAVDVRRGPDGTLDAVAPRPDVTAQAASVPGRLKDCKAAGAFRVAVPAGDHTVALLRLVGERAQLVASHPLRVT